MSTAVAATDDTQFVTALEALEGQRASVKIVGDDGVIEGNVKQASTKDGVRRFQIGRRIVSVDTITRVNGDTPDPTPEAPADPPAEAAAPKPAAKPAAAPKPPAPTVTLTSGKQATGKTLTIRCAWVDPDKRTKKQQDLFDSGFQGVEKGKTYEAMVKAAGTGKNAEAAQPDGTERVIKVQDAFQVRFCPDNQKKHRNELRRRKATARRAARQAAATK